MKRDPFQKTFRLGSVSYLNAKPLIYSLEEQSDINLGLEVPSRLIEGLRDQRYDVALLPVIDYQRLPDLQIVPSGGIGCDGPTLTVRIFSRTPIEQITVLACDTDSHTSVALARVILAERYDLRPRIVDLKVPPVSPPDFPPLPPGEGERKAARSADRPHPNPLPGGEGTRGNEPIAMLLIGDKVVCEEPSAMLHQLDLGQAWRELTGLPFVFAVWVARGAIDLADLPQRLEQAKNVGMQNLDAIVQRFAIPRGWPADLALKYMTIYLKYDIGPAQLQAIRLFHQLAAKHGMIEGKVAPLKIYGRTVS